MPDRHAATPRSSDDLAAIDALVDRLVPALTAKLAATHLGELEVREGAWRIRLRRPATAAGWHGEQRRAGDRHAPPRSSESHRTATPGGSNGTGHPAPAAHPAAAAGQPSHEADRVVATSPAVGVFRPNARATAGTRVRDGDSLGHVDVLGVRQDVLSPVDGLVGELLVPAGTAVEYGQELVVIALPSPTGAASVAGSPSGAGEAG